MERTQSWRASSTTRRASAVVLGNVAEAVLGLFTVFRRASNVMKERISSSLRLSSRELSDALAEFSADLSNEEVITSRRKRNSGSGESDVIDDQSDVIDRYSPGISEFACDETIGKLPIVKAMPYEYSSTLIVKDPELRKELHQKNPAIAKLIQDHI
mmetsp:Transcript_11773/g.14660  ORF Transcript_11773/g.14660 Transcript_11773/m.14660 type:complete len:157 (-) Transcript_11773:585-1055(-)